MRKILLSILIILLFALLGVIVIRGVELGNFELGHSVKAIINKNDELDAEIVNLSTKINDEYVEAQKTLNDSLSELQNQKKDYFNKVRYTTEEEMQKANVDEKYKMSYIWTNIGLYATKNYCDTLHVEVSNGTSGASEEYNLTFTTTGSYLDISNFIYAIEKDPNLGFKIEEFNMIPLSSGNDENKLQATFMIRNVAIDKDSFTPNVSSNTNRSTSSTNTNTSSTSESSSNTVISENTAS